MLIFNVYCGNINLQIIFLGGLTMFCKNCGQEMNDNMQFCPNCNTPVASENAAPAQQPYNAQPPYAAPQQPYGQPPVSQEPASLGLRFVCWFIPIVGIILYFVKKDEKPVYAKQCVKASIISIIVNTVVVVLFQGIAFALLGSSLY